MSSFGSLVAVGVVLLALLAVLSALTRRIHGIKPGTFASRERIVLTDQHTVQVIEIGGVRLLVGTGPSGAPAVLAELGTVEEDGAEHAAARAELPRSWARPWADLLGRLGVVSGR